MTAAHDSSSRRQRGHIGDGRRLLKPQTQPQCHSLSSTATPPNLRLIGDFLFNLPQGPTLNMGWAFIGWGPGELKGKWEKTNGFRLCAADCCELRNCHAIPL